MNGWLALLTAALGLSGAALTTWITQRYTSKRAKSDGTQKLIDQLQEERDAADKRWREANERHRQEIGALDARHRQEIADVRRDVVELRGRLEGVEDREMAYADYAAKLRDHIDQRLPPPPPKWPDALMRRLRSDHSTDR